MTEREIMRDFDGDSKGEHYCQIQGCYGCHGTDMNGEHNGYGCIGQEHYIEKRYQSILKRRMKKESTNG